METAVSKALAWSLIDQLGRQGIRFGLSIVLARLLTPAEYGLMGMLLVFLMIAQSFVDFGLSAGLIQRKEITADYATSVFCLNVVAAIVLAGVLCAISPLVAWFYAQPVLRPLLCAASLSIVIGSFGIIQTTLMTRDIDFRTQATVALVATSGSGAVALFMAWRGCGVWSLVGQSLADSLVGVVAIWWLSPWRPTGRFHWACIRGLWPFSSRLLASGLLNTAFQNLYALIIGRVYGPSDLGFYTRASTMASLPANSVTAMTQRVMFPVFARVQDDKCRLCRDFRKTLRGIEAGYFPLMTGLAAVAEPAVRCLLSDKWLPCVPYLRILCFCGMLYPLHALHLNVLTAQGRSDLFFRLEIIKKLLVVLVIAATCWISVQAMVVGTLISSVICLWVNGYYTRKLIGYGWWMQISDLLPVGALSTAMAVPVWAVSWTETWNPWGLLAVQMLVGGMLYAAMVVLLRRSLYADIFEGLMVAWSRRPGAGGVSQNVS